MAKWIKLINDGDEFIRRGSMLRILRNPAGAFDWYPDAYTDFLIFDAAAQGGYGLMVISGHKAGMINLIFPPESRGDNGVGLKCRWLIENWKKWIYPDGLSEGVWIREPEPVEPCDMD